MKTILIIIAFVAITLQVKSQPFHVITDWVLKTLYPCQGDVNKKVVSPQTINLCSNNPWALVFEDNFNSLDLSKWKIIEGVNRDEIFSNQMSYLKTTNVYVENGFLKINSAREHLSNQSFNLWIPEHDSVETFYSDFDFTSGEIWSKSKFTYGKIEARIKIPMGKGYWPAFWMFGDNPVYNEIDIFEFWNDDANGLNMTVHYDYDGDGIRKHCGSKINGPNYSANYHDFCLVWENNKIELLVDGNLLKTIYRYYNLSGQGIDCILQPYQVYVENTIYPKDAMALIFDVVMQSEKENKPNSLTLFPQQMEVDWVKYYQRKPCMDINITNQSQFPISNEVYNVIVGNNVSITNTFTVSSGQQLEVIADNSITLLGGFSVNVGATFEAKIDQTICN